MGNDVMNEAARVGLGMLTGGLSEFLYKMTPQQQADYTEAEKEIEQLRGEIEELRNGDPDKYATNERKYYDAFLGNVAKLPDPPKTDKRSVAFIGLTSSGKSSIINKLFNTSCPTSAVRCTTGIQEVHSTDRLQIVDVFGNNDEETYAKTETLMQTKRMHMVVCLYAGAVDHTIKLARLLAALRLPVTFVRNKMDAEDAGASPQIQAHDKEKLAESFGPEGWNLVLTSAKTGVGLDTLMSLVDPGGAPYAGAPGEDAGAQGEKPYCRFD